MSADQLWPRYATPWDLPEIEEIPLSARGLPESTYDVVMRAAALWPDRTAITVLPDARNWQQPVARTFSQLARDVTRTANMLRAYGIGRTNAVALIAPNCDELITATLAAEAVGVAAPINGALSAGHVTELVRLSGARVLIAAGPELDAHSWRTARTLAESGVVDTVLLLQPTGVAAARPAPRIDGVTVAYLSQEAETCDGSGLSGAPAASGNLAALFHTGGTTGTPKLAAHTHGNEVADAWMVAAGDILGEDSVIFAALPLFHVNALVVTLLSPLLRGQQVVWAGPLGYRDPALYGNFWKIVEHYRLAAMSAVPTVYQALARRPVDANISSMRSAVVGASPLPDAVRKDFESHTGIRLVEGYGLTETTCASARSFRDYPRLGSVGQRLPYQQIKAVRIDDDGGWHDMARGQVGTVVISGPTVMPGYVIGRTAEGFALDGLGKLNDGWLDTGDLAFLDDDDFVYLAGRAKDLIIRGGHNIDPAVIEDALLMHPDVTAAAAVGRPDVHAGEVPVGYVTLRSGSTATSDELRAFAAEHVTEPAAAPKLVSILDALPVTAVGKLYKLPLRADSAKLAVSEALRGLPGIVRVETHIDNGSLALLISLAAAADRHAVEEILGRYPHPFRIAQV